MRVLHVIPSVSPLRGGPSKAVLEMVAALNKVSALDKNAVEAEVATTNDHGNSELAVPLNTLTQYQGVPIRFFQRYSSRFGPIREFAYSAQFRQWINKNISHYDVIHIHAIFSFTSSYTMWVARKNKVKYVVRPIGQLEAWSLQQSKRRKQLFLSLFEQANLRAASAIHFTALSEQEQSIKSISGLAEGGVTRVIPLGINKPAAMKNAREELIQKYDLDQDKTVLLFLSRLHEKKGLELLIDALAERATDQNEHQWQLLIAGEGEASYVAQLKQKVAQADLKANCRFIGFVEGDDKNQLLQGADLFTLTSYSENFGIAVLEALAAGAPVLVSKEVALSQVIESQSLGYVCDTDVASVTSALEQALSQPYSAQDRERIANIALANYSWSSIANSLADLYRSLV